MFSLFLRNLVFTILQPGVVAALIPYLIVKRSGGHPGLKFETPVQYVGAFIFVIGATIMIACIARFAVDGRGTLSPADPTRHLVTSGLYRFSRNPMYVGVLLILIGEAIFFKSEWLTVYCCLIFLLFHTFIVFFEERRLKKDFGQDYDEYRQKVRRWI